MGEEGGGSGKSGRERERGREREIDTTGYEASREAQTVVAGEGGACSLPEVGGPSWGLGVTHERTSRVQTSDEPRSKIQISDELVFEDHRRLYHSTLGSRLIKKKTPTPRCWSVARLLPPGGFSI